MALDAEGLYQLLKPVQERLGYCFNPHDPELVRIILEGLLVNKARYGYSSCPCRLATGDRDVDRPIVCPCAFRAEDVRAYGRCYCGLYLSCAAAEGRAEVAHRVPERWHRPTSKK